MPGFAVPWSVSQHRGYQNNSEGLDGDVVQMRTAPGKSTRSERLLWLASFGGPLAARLLDRLRESY